jgi:hypothetical protein
MQMSGQLAGTNGTAAGVASIFPINQGFFAAMQRCKRRVDSSIHALRACRAAAGVRFVTLRS